MSLPMNNKPERLYGARDTSTGKLVSDITNPRRKYWDKKAMQRKPLQRITVVMLILHWVVVRIGVIKVSMVLSN